MSFELGEPPKTDVEDAFPSNMGVHKDLFETISEAHYLPDLSGPHDEALLDSLVEKGCEDNQILGQALDKLAHLVHGSGDYAEEEEDMLLSGAPVADIIDRLEHSLESPGRSSITAAQGLLHLHHIGDHMAPPEHQQSVEQYMAEEVYTAEPSAEHAMETMDAETKLEENGEVEHLVDYDPNADKRLIDEVEHDDVLYNEPVPEAHETYDDDKTNDEQLEHSEALPDQSEIAMTAEMPQDDISTDIGEQEDSQHANDLDNNETCDTNEQESILDVTQNETVDYDDKGEDDSNKDDLLPTDLSIKQVKNILPIISNNMEEIANTIEDNMSEKSDEQPKDLSVHKRLPTPHASPRRIEIPRAPSRESDAMQSPQPSGIPAIPSSPEIFTMPQTKSKQTLFLETLLSSPSPKMYTSEVTITKQQCEPLNLGKHRKSASPTVSSCSDEMRKLNKEFGEPEEKKSKKDGAEDNLVKISKVFNKSGDDHVSYSKHNKESSSHKSTDSIPPLKQLQMLKTSLEFHLPDPLLIPKDRLNHILAAPGREIPALLLQRPELRLPEAFAFPAVLQDPDILVISLSQLENILENDLKSQNDKSNYSKETSKPTTTTSTTSSTDKSSTPQPDQTSHPKPIPSMDALAGDIDAATSAALNQMIWLPYLSQLEAMAACSQNMDFLKALNSSGYTGPNYPDLSQMFNPSARFMGSGGFPMMPPMDYDNRLQFAMWQEAVNHANAAASQRPKANSAETMKDMTSKSSDVQNPYVHSTKNQQSKTHSSARTSPIAHNYNNQRSMPHHPFLQGMYPGMNANMRPNMPLPGLQIPYFNPNMMGNQRGPRSGQQKSPTSPYYPNNNYLNSVKHSEAQSHHRSSGGNERNSQESNRPRISVKSLQNLLEPTAAAASGGVGTSRRSSNPPVPSISRRRDEPEVGSTTPLGEPPPHLTPHPHDPSSFHLWHPLFGNQKSYNSPWSWTTVTATGD